jgi:hypothetical protein
MFLVRGRSCSNPKIVSRENERRRDFSLDQESGGRTGKKNAAQKLRREYPIS